jgi:hypothetical protein
MASSKANIYYRHKSQQSIQMNWGVNYSSSSMPPRILKNLTYLKKQMHLNVFKVFWNWSIFVLTKTWIKSMLMIHVELLIWKKEEEN